MELARSLAGARALGHGSAAGQRCGSLVRPLRGKEGLLAGREDELLAAIAAGQTTVLVHPRQTLPRLGRHDGRALTPMGNGSAADVPGLGRAFGRPGLGPGTHSGEDTRAVKPFRALSNCRVAEPVRRVASRRHVDDSRAPRLWPPSSWSLAACSLGASGAATRRPPGAVDPPTARRAEPATVGAIEHPTGADRRRPPLRGGRRVRDAGLPRDPGTALHAVRRRDDRLPEPDARAARAGRVGLPNPPVPDRQAERGADPGLLMFALGEGGLGVARPEYPT